MWARIDRITALWLFMEFESTEYMSSQKRLRWSWNGEDRMDTISFRFDKWTDKDVEFYVRTEG